MPDADPENDEFQEEPAEKPRFLLPAGCKDLIDVLQPRGFGSLERPLRVELGQTVLVSELAAMLHLTGFEITWALMRLDVFALPSEMISYELAEAVCASYGVLATPAEP